MGKKDSGIICDGHIDTEKIYATHRQIKEIVESYKDVNLEVSQITKKIKRTGLVRAEMNLNLSIIF